MPVEREVIQFVGAADFTDDCRVVVELRKKRMTLTITEARDLMAELFAAIQEAQRGANDLAREVRPAGFDRAVHPECVAGKCGNCDGQVLTLTDEWADCQHACHDGRNAA